MSQTHLTPHPPFDHFCIFMSTCRPMEVIPPFRHHQRWFDVLTWCPTKVVAVVSRWSPAPNAAARIGKMTMRDLECPVRWILITPCFSCLAWYKIRCSAPRLWLYNTLYRAGEGKAQNFGKPVCRMWNANMIWIIGQIKWNLICIQWNPLWEFILKVLVMLLVEPDKCQLLFFWVLCHAKHRDFWRWYVICCGLENLDYVMVQTRSDTFKHYCECWTSWWLVEYHTLNIFHA